MLYGSTEFNALSNTGARLYTKLTYEENGNTIIVSDADEIQDITISHKCNADNYLEIGTTCSAELTFSIYNPTYNLENKELTLYEGIEVSGAIEYLQIGLFTVYETSKSGNTITFTCYDRMQLADIDFTPDETMTMTDTALLSEISSQTGLSYVLPSDWVTHSIVSVSNLYTCKEYISYIAQLQGKNAYINASGVLAFKWYETQSYTIDDSVIYADGTQDINAEEDFSIDVLEVNVTNNGTTTTYTSGSGTMGISFDNPWYTQAILDTLYTNIGGFTYRAVEIEFLGDIRLQCGDLVSLTTGGVTYSVPIMQIEHRIDGGIVTVITSIAETESDSLTTSTTSTERAIRRVIQTVYNMEEDVETAITLAEQTADKFYWLVTSGSSSTSITLTNAMIEAVTNQLVIKGSDGTTTVISGGEITANNLSALSADLGTVTAGIIQSLNYATSGGTVTDGCQWNLNTNTFVSPNMSWNDTGELTVTNGTFTGEINATSGTIGNLTITDDGLTYTDTSVVGASTLTYSMGYDSDEQSYSIRMIAEYEASMTSISGVLSISNTMAELYSYADLGAFGIRTSGTKTIVGSFDNLLGALDCGFDIGYSSISATGNILPSATNTYTLGSSSYKWSNVYATTFTGALSGNATTATTATKLGSSTVGGTAKPIYLNSGTATAISATVGSGTKPVYLNAGTVTVSSSTVGNALNGVYLNAGTITELSTGWDLLATITSTSLATYSAVVGSYRWLAFCLSNTANTGSGQALETQVVERIFFRGASTSYKFRLAYYDGSTNVYGYVYNYTATAIRGNISNTSYPIYVYGIK